MSLNKAFFLDRDGVINKDHGYVHSWDNFDLIDQTIEALELIQKNDYLIIIITNQAGIARGYYQESDFWKLMNQFNRHVLSLNIAIDGIYFCPHHPEGTIPQYRHHCPCRKPEPGMIHLAAAEHRIDLSRSYLVGDKVSDIQAGIQSGLKESFIIDPHPNSLARNFNSLFDCVNSVLKG